MSSSTQHMAEAKHAGIAPGAAPGEPKEMNEATKSTADDSLQTKKERSQRLATDARRQATAYLAGQKDAVANSLGDFSEATRKVAETLRESDDATAARCTEAAAEKAAELSRYLREREPSQMLGDLEDATRRHPAAVYGGLFAAGLAISRFLRSSERRPAHR